MQRVLVTGLGGAGRTTVAAATALAAASAGHRTLLLSAQALTVLGVPVDGPPERPDPVADGLWAARIDTAGDFRAEFLDLQDRVSAALDLLGATPFEDEELTELPGSGEFALLRALANASHGGWDVLVADLPPLDETVALLALPERLRRYLRRLLPPERQAARALRPVLAQLAGVPMPAQWLYETAGRWDTALADVQAAVESPGTRLTVVAEPGPAAAERLRAVRPGLGLFGHAVHAVVANRMVPADSPDPWVASLAAQQARCLKEWHGAWPPAAAVGALPHLGRDPRGLGDLGRLAALPVLAPPTAAGAREGLPEPVHGDGGTLVWRLPLPGAVKEELSLVRRGDELLVTAGPFRRILPLPPVLRRCTVAGAGLADGTLSVRFTPDPGLWPRTR
ncbi:ArsA family ATPase [Streptomyces sp. t39]|uniref:ArsA family ATPase n=1 Tax=Streptomyces sp. t39 TaxID=1828156 RepID=UPI0011CEC3D8|nr:ArsA-related P-loop ATPase [Streptomyces sp. t39]TXS50889.1 ArsA family ATPase [Streptomyces sp. t39]